MFLYARSFRLIFFGFILVTLWLSGCSKQPRQEISSITEINPYVFAYTSGVISRTEPIRVEFAESMIAEEQVGTEPSEKLFRFSPGLSGTTSWEDQRTLRFDPEQAMPSGMTYDVRLDVQALFAEAKGKDRSFSFAFQVREQYLQVEVDGLRPVQLNDLRKQSLTGQVFTADKADVNELEECLRAQQQGQDLPISWSHSADGRVHDFTVGEIKRQTEASDVQLSWSGKPIGADGKGQKSIRVPSINEFSLQDVSLVAEGGTHLQLTFSDPLDPQQDLSGLITLSEYSGRLRFLVDNNLIKVWPEIGLTGERRVNLSENIRNLSGKPLGNRTVRTVEFAEIAPKLRLVGSGMIMPETEQLLFPFDAIGLEKVEVEIFKIYHNNILQFLQVNTLGSDYSLQQVGNIIRREEVDLQRLSPGASPYIWTRYALDLRQLIQDDREAIYSVRIGFRPEHAVMSCAAERAGALSFYERYGQDNLDPNYQKSILDGYYGILGYYDGYQYRNRNEPCSPEYYNSDRFISRKVLSTNLGVLAKKGKTDALTVVVTDLRDATPVSGAQVIAYDYQQQEIGRYTTNGQGMVQFNPERAPFALIASAGGQKSYLRLANNESLALNRFDVGGAETQEGIKGFLYADRGVWRPGDSVFLNFMLDDRDNPLPDNYPITLEVTNARGQQHLKRTVMNEVGQIYPLHFDTPENAPTGRWLASVQVGGATFTKALRIETVKPNRMEINLNAEQERLLGREKAAFNLEARWLHGAPAANLEARVEADIYTVSTRFSNYPSFRFDDPARSNAAWSSQTLFESALDGRGQASFTWDLPDEAQAPGMMEVGLRTRVFERGGDYSIDSYRLPYAPYNSFVGLEIPRDAYNSPRVEVGRNATLRMVTVDPDGNPLSNRNLSIDMYRVNWRWWWDDGYDNMSRYNSRSNYRPVYAARVVTNNDGGAQWQVAPDEWGRYFVRVCDEESGHCTGDFLYAGNPIYGDPGEEERELASLLNVATDQETYAIGEQVTLTVPSGLAGRALISIENGTQVLETFWEETQEGTNTFTFKTTEAMSPNVYAHVTLLQPHAQTENDLPIRLYGVVPITVEDPGTRIEPVLTMPDELEPESTFTLEVSESDGRPMSYTVAVVDEGLLGLTRFSTPDPHLAFYAKEALGVRTWDMYNEVLGAVGSDLSNILTIGGDAAVATTAMNPTANRFEPVVRHVGPFQLDRNGSNQHQITLPNYVGAVRTMIVARSASAYGQTAKSVPVKNPLMLLATLPRVLTPGETLQIPVNVFVNEPNLSQVRVQVNESSGLVSLPSGKNRTLNFAQTGSQMTYVPVEVGDQPGIARFSINAASGGATASQEIEVEIRNPNPYQSQILATTLDGGESWTQDFPGVGMPGTRRATLEVSNIPPINLDDRLRYLLRYPYGCIEQTVSQVFPQLYAAQLIELTDQQKADIPQRIQAGIQRIGQFQLANGGMAYWPGGNEAGDWVTSYAGHFLLAAQEKGYRVSPGLMNDWKRYQQRQSRNWSPLAPDQPAFVQGQHQLTQAYRLYTLALAGSADLPAMNRMREMDANLALAARWRLAAAYAVSGKTDVGRELISGATTEMQDYREMGRTYGSTFRDEALVLETLVLLDDEARAGNLVQRLSKTLSSQTWLNTQETAYALMAISKYVGDAEVGDNFRFTYTVNEQTSQDAGSTLPIFQVAIGRESLNNDNTVTITNRGNNRLFVQVITEGQPRPGEETGQDNNLRLQVNYLNLDGTPLDPTRIEQGRDFIAEVRVTHPGQLGYTYEELALNQVFPSGWEIVNTRMDALSGATQSAYEYQDIRDDRVNTFFDLNPAGSRTYRVQLTAAYPGQYYLPGTSCQAMYEERITAYQAGQWVEVFAPEEAGL